jgi:hypothetical protein
MAQYIDTLIGRLQALTDLDTIMGTHGAEAGIELVWSP